jgi:hypothetical protein
MALDLKNLMHVEQDVGQHIKSTKKHFVWEFLLDSKPHKIELYDSKLSGKKKVIKDGLILVEIEEDFSAFSKSFEIGKHACTIIQHGEKYELRIDNQSFNHLMDLEKNKIYFQDSNQPTSTTYQTKGGVSNDKVGFGLSMKNLTQNSNFNSNKSPGGLFNFAIKPVTPNNQPKKFNEINPVHDFNKNKRENVMSKESEKNTNNNLLIDFNDVVSSEVGVVSKESKGNTFDVFNLNLDPNMNDTNTMGMMSSKVNNNNNYTDDNVFDLVTKSNTNNNMNMNTNNNMNMNTNNNMNMNMNNNMNMNM